MPSFDIGFARSGGTERLTHQGIGVERAQRDRRTVQPARARHALQFFDDALSDHFAHYFRLSNIVKRFNRHVVGFADYSNAFRVQYVGRPDECSL